MMPSAAIMFLQARQAGRLHVFARLWTERDDATDGPAFWRGGLCGGCWWN